MVRWVNPDATLDQLLRASLFSLALGGFGLLLTAYAVWRYPDPNWLWLAFGAVISGYLTVLGLLTLRHARRVSRN